MKKIISIILCAAMLCCCIPYAAFAAEVVFNDTASFTSSNELESGSTYVVNSGVTMTVPASLTLYLPGTFSLLSGATLRVDGNLVILNGGSLIVNEDAVLNVGGSVKVENGGELKVKGTVKGSSSKVLIDEGADAVVAVNFPALADYMLDGKVEVSYLSSDKNYADVTEAGEFTPVPDGGALIDNIPFNNYLYIKAHIIEAANDSGSPDAGRDKFDDSLLWVYANGNGIPYASGVHYTQIGTSTDISYTFWKNDDDFLTTKTIAFPTGEGYEVIGRDGETAGDSGLKVKYGQPFSFRVEIDEAYDMSDYKVYVYNGYGWLKINPNQATDEEIAAGVVTLLDEGGVPSAVADSDGYYTIKRVTGDITIKVEGVVKNETINLISNILDTIRNIFNLLKEFFESIFAGFKK